MREVLRILKVLKGMKDLKCHFGWGIKTKTKMSALGVPQTKIFLGVYFALTFYFALNVRKANEKLTIIDRALPFIIAFNIGYGLVVSILANTTVLKWYHVVLYALVLEILSMVIKKKKSNDLGDRLELVRSNTSGWTIVALILYLRSQST